MDPTYFLKGFNMIGKDNNDIPLEIDEEVSCAPNGDWMIDLSEYDGGFILYNSEKYIKIIYTNDVTRMYCYLNGTDYHIYQLSIRQLG
jgi:hypothetical protein